MSELKVLSAGAVKGGVTEMTDAYAREHGGRVTVEFTTAPEVRRRVTAGEDVDVVVAPPVVMDELAKAGKVIQESRSMLGRSRMGVAVHADSPIRDIPDVESFKQMLLSAKSVVHNKASSGIYSAKLLEKLCPAVELGSRVVVVESGAAVMEYVAAHGPGAVGLAQISEIRVLVAKGLPVRLAAPLPEAVQNVTSYEAAAVSGRKESDKAQALASYMATPDAKKVFAATGID